MRRTGKTKKPTPKVEFEVHGALQLPRHIRENIRHPLLRLGWFTELNGRFPKGQSL
jgi:hypothetical protein